MKLHMFKRIALISLCFFSLHGMQKSAQVTRTDETRAAVASNEAIQHQSPDFMLCLKWNNQQVRLRLDVALHHICGYQQIIDPVTYQEKISGLHYYSGHGKKIKSWGSGSVIELSDSLWIYTEGDRTTFHVGYLIYQGRVLIDQPKSFFPCTWSQEELVTHIKEAARSDKITWEEEQKTASKIFRATVYFQNTSLKLVIKQYPQRSVLLTVYPDIEIKPVKESILEELAQEQLRLLRAIRQSRLTSITEQAKRRATKQEEVSPKPELFRAIEWALREDADKNFWYNEITACLKAGADPHVTDDEGRTGLMLAAQYADQMLITELLEAGASKDQKDRKGRTVLEYALSSCQYSAVLPFLSVPDQLNRFLSSGVTPLIYAIDRFSVELVELLLDYGADANMLDSLGFTPLMHVVRHAHLSEEAVQNSLLIINLLLEKGADIDAQRRDLRTARSIKLITREEEHEEAGDTALMHAVISGNESAVKVLLEAQADYTILNEKKQTALKIAQNKGFPKVEAKITEFIKKKEEWIAAQKADELIYAAYKDNSTRVRKLLRLMDQKKIDCKINGTGCKDTGLYYAVDHNNLHLVNDLLRAGADPRLRCSTECTIVEYAQAAHISSDIKEVLQERARELNAPKKQAQQRAEQRKKQAIEQFKKEVDQDQVTLRTLEIIKEINPCLVDGHSPLVYALKKGKIRAIDVLSKHKFCYQDEKGDLLFFPESKNEKEILKVLLRNGCAQEKEQVRFLKSALKKERRDVLVLLGSIPHFFFNHLKTFLEKGEQEELIAEICRCDNVLTFEQAAACLLLAINKGRHATAQLLAQYYSLTATSYRDEHGMTPLMHAAGQCMTELCKQLVDLGADFEACDSEGRSVMDYVPQKSTEGKKLREFFEKRKKELEVAEHVEQEKDDYDAKQLVSKGWTPAMVAAYRNDVPALATFTKDEINKTNADGLTPLHTAVMYKRDRAVTALLKRSDIEISAQDAAGLTPLHHAVKHDNEAAVEKLLSKEAPVLLSDKSGSSVFLVNKSNPRAVRIREKLKSALIREISKNMSSTMSSELLLLLSHFKNEEREKFYRELWASGIAGVPLSNILKEHQELRQPLAHHITNACNLIIFSLSKETEDVRKAQVIIKGLSVNQAEALIMFDLTTPILLMYAAIAVEHISLLSYLCDTFRNQMKTWRLDDRLMAQETSVKEISPVMWAWLLRKRNALKIFFEKNALELTREIMPHRIPAWLFIVFTFYSDPELSNLISEWLEVPKIRQFLSNGDAVHHICRQHFWDPILLLLTEKKINPHLRDSNGNTLVMSALESEFNESFENRGEKDKPQAMVSLAEFLRDLIGRCRVDCNQVNNQGISPFEFVIRKGQVDAMIFFLTLPACECVTRVPLPQAYYLHMVRFFPIPIICSHLKDRSNIINTEQLAVIAVREKNVPLLAILLSRLNETATDNLVTYALHLGDEAIVQLLIDRGKLRVNKIYKPVWPGAVEGSDTYVTGTPLMIAIFTKNLPLVAQLLKQKDIDLSLEDQETHRSALTMARGHSALNLMFEAYKRGKDPEQTYVDLVYISLLSRDFSQAVAELKILPPGIAQRVKVLLIERFKPLEFKHITLPHALVLNCPVKGFPVKRVRIQGSGINFCLSNGLIACWQCRDQNKKISYYPLLESSSPITSFEMSHDGRYLLTAHENGSIITINLEKLGGVTISQITSEPILWASFTNATDLECLFVTKSGQIRRMKVEKKGEEHTAITDKIAQCPDPLLKAHVENERLLGVAADGYTLNSYSLTGESKALKFTQPINAVVQSQDPNTVFVAAGNKLIAARLSEATSVCMTEEHNENITHLTLSGDGEWLLSSTSRDLTLWAVGNNAIKEGKFLRMNVGHFAPLAPIHSIALNEDGSHAVVGSDDGVIRLIGLKLIEKLSETVHILLVGRYLHEGKKLLENETARQVFDTLPKGTKDALSKYSP